MTVYYILVMWKLLANLRRTIQFIPVLGNYSMINVLMIPTIGS